LNESVGFVVVAYCVADWSAFDVGVDNCGFMSQFQKQQNNFKNSV